MILILSRPGQPFEETHPDGSAFKVRIGGYRKIEELKTELAGQGMAFVETNIIGSDFLGLELDADRFSAIAYSDEELQNAFRESMKLYNDNSLLLPPQLKFHEIGRRPAIMGILNVTPDSFSDGGLFNDREDAVKHALEMIDAGADIVDVGGESTRPGSSPVSMEEELKRVIPVIGAIAAESDVPISVDTTKPQVASAAISAGAAMVNDVSGLSSPEMRKIVADGGSAAVIMHMKGEPRTMQVKPTYVDVVTEISLFFKERLRLAVADGIEENSLMIDPGIGFGKSVSHNLQLLSELDAFRCLGRPLLLGASRKSFIAALTGDKQTSRLEGSLASALFGWLKGAAMLRVHDVPETVRFLNLWKSMVKGAPPD